MAICYFVFQINTLRLIDNNYFYGIQESHKDKKKFYIIVPIEFGNIYVNFKIDYNKL